jgi:hypothetical protein
MAAEAAIPVRLACVRRAASVRSEPGSNSQLHPFFPTSTDPTEATAAPSPRATVSLETPPPSYKGHRRQVKPAPAGGPFRHHIGNPRGPRAPRVLIDNPQGPRAPRVLKGHPQAKGLRILKGNDEPSRHPARRPHGSRRTRARSWRPEPLATFGCAKDQQPHVRPPPAHPFLPLPNSVKQQRSAKGAEPQPWIRPYRDTEPSLEDPWRNGQRGLAMYDRRPPESRGFLASPALPPDPVQWPGDDRPRPDVRQGRSGQGRSPSALRIASITRS